MLRIILTTIFGLAIVVVAILGFRGQTSTRPPLLAFDDMVDQPRYAAQGESAFFADGRAMRTPPAGTVPWGRSRFEPDAVFVVRDEDNFAATALPVPIDRELLRRGQSQFNIYCAVCHDMTGESRGLMSDYGMIVASLHTDRVRQMPPGEMYEVITNGRGLMGPYRRLVKPEDRWAIIAYVRALQRAYTGTIEDVPERLRGELE